MMNTNNYHDLSLNEIQSIVNNECKTLLCYVLFLKNYKKIKCKDNNCKVKYLYFLRLILRKLLNVIYQI